MISASGLALQLGKRFLFQDVHIEFTPGHCYGIVGANGSGKSTLLRMLADEIRPTKGSVSIGPGERIAMQRHNHYEFDAYDALEAVMLGAGEPSGQDARKAGRILVGLGIPPEKHRQKMANLAGRDKLRVLLAQALFGDPDILLLDEPTKQLDLSAIRWLENFLRDFPHTVVVVSRDRHFLNRACTHIIALDGGSVQMHEGNYDAWRKSCASAHRYPDFSFVPSREAGNHVLGVEHITKVIAGETILNNVSFMLKKGDKAALVGPNRWGKTMIFQMLAGELLPDEGRCLRDDAAIQAYLPKDSTQYFDGVDGNLVEWLRRFVPDADETRLRDALERTGFSAKDAKKAAKLLSSEERVRCMLARIMLSGANVLLLDEPTKYLDLASIAALNDALIAFPGALLFASRDHEFVQTVANRIIDITPDGVVDRMTTYEEFLRNETVQQQLAEKYRRS